MAVPDARATFDIFKPLTTTGDWLEAFLEERVRPNQRQVFNHRAMSAFVMRNGRNVPSTGFFGERQASVSGQIAEFFEQWRSDQNSDTYIDAHCTVMIPSSVELMLLETRALGLITLSIDALETLPGGFEFLIRLRKQESSAVVLDENEITLRRTLLYRKLCYERRSLPATLEAKGRFGNISRFRHRLTASLATSAKNLAARVFGADRAEAVRRWNRARRRKR